MLAVACTACLLIPTPQTRLADKALQLHMTEPQPETARPHRGISHRWQRMELLARASRLVAHHKTILLVAGLELLAHGHSLRFANQRADQHLVHPFRSEER